MLDTPVMCKRKRGHDCVDLGTFCKASLEQIHPWKQPAQTHPILIKNHSEGGCRRGRLGRIIYCLIIMSEADCWVLYLHHLVRCAPHNNLKGWVDHQHFTSEETEAQELCNRLALTKALEGKGKIWIQALMATVGECGSAVFDTISDSQMRVEFAELPEQQLANSCSGTRLPRSWFMPIIWFSSYELQTSYSASQRRQKGAQIKCKYLFPDFQFLNRFQQGHTNMQSSLV